MSQAATTNPIREALLRQAGVRQTQQAESPARAALRRQAASRPMPWAQPEQTGASDAAWQATLGNAAREAQGLPAAPLSPPTPPPPSYASTARDAARRAARDKAAALVAAAGEDAGLQRAAAALPATPAPEGLEAAAAALTDPLLMQVRDEQARNRLKGNQTIVPGVNHGTFGQNLAMGARMGWQQQAIPALGGSMNTTGDYPSTGQAPGVGGMIGQTVAGTVAGMLNPKNLPELVAGTLAGTKMASAARPIIGRITRLAGRRAGAIAEQFVEEASDEALFAFIQEAQAIGGEQWASDPAGSLYRSIQAAGIGGATGGVMGGAMGTTSSTPRLRRDATVTKTIGEMTGVETDAPRRVREERRIEGQQAMRDAAKAYLRPPPFRETTEPQIGKPETWTDAEQRPVRVVRTGPDAVVTIDARGKQTKITMAELLELATENTKETDREEEVQRQGQDRGQAAARRAAQEEGPAAGDAAAGDAGTQAQELGAEQAEGPVKTAKGKPVAREAILKDLLFRHESATGGTEREAGGEEDTGTTRSTVFFNARRPDGPLSAKQEWELLPAEIKEEFTPAEARKAGFEVTNQRNKAGAEDYAYDVGWENYLDEVRTGISSAKVAAAREFFRSAPFDPEAAFLSAAVGATSRNTKGLRMTSADALEDGDTFTIGGVRLRVVSRGKGESKTLVITDPDGTFPDTPVWAFESRGIPMDAGSLRGRAAAASSAPRETAARPQGEGIAQSKPENKPHPAASGFRGPIDKLWTRAKTKDISDQLAARGWTVTTPDEAVTTESVYFGATAPDGRLVSFRVSGHGSTGLSRSKGLRSSGPTIDIARTTDVAKAVEAAERRAVQPEPQPKTTAEAKAKLAREPAAPKPPPPKRTRNELADEMRMAFVSRGVKPEQVEATIAVMDAAAAASGEGVDAWWSKRIAGTTTEAPGKGALTQPGDGQAARTDTPEFKAWFGNSKVVDSEGKPLVVYHGTHNAGFRVFRSPAYFTTSRDIARSYADDPGEFGTKQGRRGIEAVYLNIKNPKRVKKADKTWFAMRGDPAATVKKLEANGHDGIVYADTSDGVSHDNYVAFYPEQIKSVNNRGTWDPGDPNILHQSATNEPAPIFYSKLRQTIETTPKLGKTFTRQQLTDALIADAWVVRLKDPKTDKEKGQSWQFDNAAAAAKKAAEIDGKVERITIGKDGVKPEEVEWANLEALPDGKLTREQVLEHLDENAVQVTEVRRGGEPTDTDIFNKFVTDAVAFGVDGDTAKKAWGVFRTGTPDTNPIAFWREWDQRFGDHATTLRHLINRADVERSGRKTPTRHDTYVVPGADPGSYREILLTIPAKPREFMGYDEWLKQNVHEEFRAPQYEVGNRRVYESDREKATKPLDTFRYPAHWDEENVLAHVRFNTRTGPDGKKTLFLEEVQSDWHQEGRKKGYKTKHPNAEKDRARFYEGKGDMPDAEWEALSQRVRAADAAEKGVPDAPFKDSWAQLALKRMIRYAAETGHDRIAWTTGDTQNRRWSSLMQEHVDELTVTRADDGTYTVKTKPPTPNGREYNEDGISADKLHTVIGDELAKRAIEETNTAEPDELTKRAVRAAEKVLAVEREQYGANAHEIRQNGDMFEVWNVARNTPFLVGSDRTREIAIVSQASYAKGWRQYTGEPRPPGTFDSTPMGKAYAEFEKVDIENIGNNHSRTYTGLDLKVGGEGMRAFYDRMLVNKANDLLKKHGGKAGLFDVGMMRKPGETTWEPFTDVDYDAYAGAEEFYNGDRPMMTRATVRINGGGPESAIVVMDANGFYIDTAGGENYRYDLVNPPASRRTHEQMKEKWGRIVSGRDSVAWRTMDGDVVGQMKIIPETVGPTEDTRAPGFDIPQSLKDEALTKGMPLFQKNKRGAVTFLEDGRALIHALEGADASTALHEIGHIFRRNLPEDEQRIVDEHYGVKDGKWTRDLEERYATDIERYAAEGKAPTPELQPIFDKFRTWMLAIYKAIKDGVLGKKLTPEMRDHFDRMLGKPRNAEEAKLKADLAAKAKETSDGTPKEALPPQPQDQPEAATPAGGIQRDAGPARPGDAAAGADGADAPPVVRGDLPAQPEPNVIGLNKAEQDRLRKEVGLDELPEAERRKWTDVLSTAKSEGLDARAMEVAEQILESGRQMTDAEHAGAVLKAAELANEYDRQVADARAAERAGKDSAALRDAADATAEQIALLTEATRYSRRETARALAIGRMMVDREDFTIAKVIARAREIKGGKGEPAPLTNAERERLESLTTLYKQQAEALAELQARDNKQRAEIAKLKAGAVIKAAAPRVPTAAQNQARFVAQRRAITAERADLKKKLLALGHRVNDITGIGPEALYLIGRLALNYAREGAVTLAEVVAKVQADMPDLTAEDIYAAIAARSPARQARARNAAERRVKELKTQAQLLNTLDMLSKGLEPTAQAKAAAEPPSPEVADLRAKVAAAKSVLKAAKADATAKAPEIRAIAKVVTQLRTQVYKTAQSGRQVEKAIETINRLQDHLANGTTPAKAAKKATTVPAELQAAREKIRELQRLLRTRETLDDLQQQLATGQIREPLHREPERVSRELEQAQIAVRKTRAEIRAALSEMRPWTARRVAGEIANTSRTMMATADMSATFRQAALLSARRPITATVAFTKAARAFFRENTARQIDNALRSHPNQLARDRAKLYLSDIDGPTTAREEHFQSSVARRLPFFRAIAAASERHMATHLNLMRVAAFDGFLKNHPNATQAELQAWADYVNKASGRGDLGRFAGAATELSTIFFAPRFAVSRFQAPWAVVKHWKQPTVRKEIAKDLAAFVGTGMAALALASLAGADVGDDPRDPDFGKIRIGDTRVDIWGGFQQPARLIARLIAGATDQAGLTGENLTPPEKDVNPLELMYRFAAFKLAPGVTVPVSMYTGKDAVGRPQARWETALKAFAPITMVEIIETAREYGATEAAIVGAANFVGLGAGTYPDSEAQTRKKIRQERAAGNLQKSEAMRRAWNAANPDNRIADPKK